MLKKLFIYFQYILPQHLLSSCMGALAESRTHWLKNFLIRWFIRFYPVNMQEAEIEDPYAYPTFNDFFTRQLKSSARRSSEDPKNIVSPVDGTLTQIGQVNEGQILQAKEFYFDLKHLLVDEKRSADFYGGHVATFYLAPHDYHRVHMPFAGNLIETIYVPGKLFSVNKMTCDLIPGLYARNERFISFFETELGPMAVILVAAMIVGGMQMAWMQQPLRAKKIITEQHSHIKFAKGAELGLFKMGSTVMVLFEKNRMSWDQQLSPNSAIKVGQSIGKSLFTL